MIPDTCLSWILSHIYQSLSETLICASKIFQGVQRNSCPGVRMYTFIGNHLQATLLNPRPSQVKWSPSILFQSLVNEMNGVQKAKHFISCAVILKIFRMENITGKKKYSSPHKYKCLKLFDDEERNIKGRTKSKTKQEVMAHTHWYSHTLFAGIREPGWIIGNNQR